MVQFAAGRNSEFVFVSGKVSWVKGITPNQWDKWALTLHPDAESLEKIRDLQAEGVKNVIKKDEDGYYVQFSRPIMIQLRNGQKTPLAPPEITHKDGTPMEGVPIGNGSDGIVKLEVYQHPTPNGGRAKAARWASLRIDNLIPFNKDEDYPEDRKKLAEGLAEQPEPLF